MKTVVLTIASLIVISWNANAQIGRHELPLDTVPIGGEQQQVQEDKMAGQDDLVISLTLLRDSVNTFMATPEGKQFIQNQLGENALPSLQKKLESVITSLKNSEKNEEMMKKGYALRDRIRKSLKERVVHSETSPGID